MVSTKSFVFGTVALAAVAQAGVVQAGPNGERYAAFAIDGVTGETVYSRNGDDLRYPASLTKIMTLYVLFEEIEAGRFTLDSKLPVSAYAAARPPSKIGVRAGQTIRVEDAILALVTKSANDVSVVIAEAVAGSVEGFAKLMNARAASIGMSRTTFQNPHGLPNRGQVTTARDMATLGRSIQWRFPTYYKYFATRSFSYRGTAYRNHNRLLGRVAGVDGIKTGFIRASGFNLVANMVRNNRHVVAVVMGGRSGASRNAEMERVLALAYDRVSRFDVPLAATSPRALTLATLPLPRPNPAAANVIATVPGATKIEQRDVVETLIDPATGELQVARAASVSAPTRAPAEAPRQAPAPVAALETRATPGPEITSIEQLTRLAQATAPSEAETAQQQQPSPERVALEAAHAPQPSGTPQSIEDLLLTASVTTVSITVPSRVVTADGTLVEPAPQAQAQVQQPQPETPAIGFAPIAQATAQQPAAEQAIAEVAPPAGSWFIQIGAYNDRDSALDRMTTARSLADHLLAEAAPYTETVDSNGRTLWRARFAGLDRSNAQAACDYLESRDFGCFAQQL
ncbi:MAG: serine hydrolase [Pseudomonadota bacterium]